MADTNTTKKRGLGRGLDALVRDGMNVAPPPSRGSVLKIPVEKIRRNTYQPRHRFDEEPLKELTDSIRMHGILQPLLVRAAGEGFELIAGERRLRAAGEAGLTEVPALVMEAPDVLSLELALVENLQRENLNVLDEADGYQTLADKFNLTQEQIAERVGKSRAAVANTVRLLALPDEVKALIADSRLSAGHAKALSGLDIAEEQTLLARRALRDNLSVRNLEKLVQRAKRAPRKPRVARGDIPDTHLRALSDKLHAFFGTSVRLTPCRTYANGKKGKGCLEIDFYSSDDLNRILDVLGLIEQQ